MKETMMIFHENINFLFYENPLTPEFGHPDIGGLLLLTKVQE
jgi:hypothetical protein